jgi:hypothetical protein
MLVGNVPNKTQGRGAAGSHFLLPNKASLCFPAAMPLLSKAKCLLALPLLCAFIHAEDEPKVIQPGTNNSAPSDAIVLFDGHDLSKWSSANGEAKWKVEGGAATVNGTGNIRTKEEFSDVQLHIEWATPSEVKGESQGRGNSGVYLEGRYEIQVLDSYNNKTYFNGQAGAFYGNFAPLVNASRKPGEWQSYDIVFHPPRRAADGKSVQPGSFTVLHNGILALDHVPVKGDSTTSADFKDVSEKGPLVLQDHGNPVRYRNIWIRKIEPPKN